MRLFLGLVAVAACNPVVAHTPDGKTADSSPDAPTFGMVTVKVYDPNNTGAVVVGVPVVFVEADGTLVGHPVTASDGTASANVHVNASATVVITTQGSTQMQTLTGLQPGDNIILGPTTGTPTQLAGFSVSFPTYPGAVSYDVYGPCGSTNTTTSPIALSMQSDCKLDTMDITVVAKSMSASPLAYTTKTGVMYVANGTTAITGSYSGLSPFSASYTDMNAVITNASLTRAMPDGFGYSGGTSGTPANGTLSLMTSGPAGAKATVSTSFSKTGSSQLVQQEIDGNAQTYGMDVGMTLLPWVGSPTLDLTTGKVTVPIDMTGTTTDAPDLYFAQIAYSRTVGTTTTNFAWLTFAANAGDFTLPALPMEVGDVMPKPTDTNQGGFGGMVESEILNGYGDVRSDVYTKINAVTNAPHPTAMRVRESTSLLR